MRKSVLKIKAILLTIIAIAAFTSIFLIQYFLIPSRVEIFSKDEISINFLSYRSFWFEGIYSLSIQHGSKYIEYPLWEGWGPTQSANIYSNSFGDLIVISAGNLSVVVDNFMNGISYSVPAFSSLEGSDSTKWKYWGTLQKLSDKGYVYFTAEEKNECLQVEKIYDIPYRIEYQQPYC